MSTLPFLVQVHGDGLVALAAALRLARLGHRVRLVSPRPVWRAASASSSTALLAPVLELPAAWRDLFSKTGRSMDAELAGRGLSLVEAPATTHRLDADSLALPTERAAQLSAVRSHFGAAAADAWRSVLDSADRAWQARRRLGLEYPVTSPPRLRGLPEDWTGRRGRSLAGPEGLPPLLSAVMADLGPMRGGAPTGRGARLLISDLAVARVFGRWYLTGPSGPSTSLQPLLDVLDRRLGTREVEVLADPPRTRPDVVVRTDAPATSRGRAYLAPTVDLSREPLPTAPVAGIHHRVDHTADGPVERWRWTEGDELVSLVHDHTRPVPAAWMGPGLASTRAWARRPPLEWRRDHGTPTLVAGTASHGGTEPWAQLLTGALAAYLVHLRLTGLDVSPHNRAIGADGRPRPHLPPHLSA